MKSFVLATILLVLAGHHGPTHADIDPQPPETSSTFGPRWESRWGAIATDEVKGIFGSSTGMSEREEARRSALENCTAKGGAHCELAVSYSNSCSAVVIGDKGFHVDWASTEENAIRASMKTCGTGDANCRTFFTSCSPPQLIQ